MSSRQPRLHWIKEVLADLAADGERAPAPRGVVRQCETALADARSADDLPAASDGEGGLMCPSWQLIRLAVTPSCRS
jgi:hypothetical protein